MDKLKKMDKYMDLFKLNDKIELKSSDDGKSAGFIYDIKEDGLLVSISADDENFKLMQVGESIKASIYSKAEVISFDANIESKEFINAPVYKIINIRNFTSVQRRENIRVRFTMDLLYSNNEFLTKLEYRQDETLKNLEKIEKYLKEGHLTDLSAGGMKLSSKEDLQAGTLIIIVMNLKNHDMILKGKIVHKEVNLLPKRTVYQYGIKFLDITEDQEETIISQLFVIMRKNRIK